jgi:large subunit ribosomal protein L13
MASVCAVSAPTFSIRTAAPRSTTKSVGVSKAFAGARLAARPARFAVSVKPQAATAAAATESLGPDLWNKSYYPKAADHLQVNKPWYIVDAEGQTLGRVATLVANNLRGANMPTYSPSVDMGGYVVVINAEKIEVTGNKKKDKLYRNHTTGRPGKMKVETFEQLQARIPERIVEKAVKGMLPKGALGRTLFTHLKVFKGSDHPHSAQMPVDITSQVGKKATRISPLN